MNLQMVLLQAQAGGGSGIMNIAMIVLIFVVFYFFMIRPQMKKQKETSKFRDSLLVGDNVMTAGGIYGKIKEINDNVISLEIAKDVIVKIDRSSIYQSAADVQQQQK
ncbi:MAG: preprotein translocase subunit YajC [Paludibacteraceae bacterium]|nr:preprotein translocase subunit YajC [Paludibacteraceae bacterium]